MRFFWNNAQVLSCFQVWTRTDSNFFYFFRLYIHSLSPELLSLWIFAIHFATKHVGTNLHGNFLLQNEFDVSGGVGVPLDQPTRFSISLMILFRAKVWLITSLEHLPWPCCDFASANKSTRKTAPFCLWLIYCIVLSRLSSLEQRANTPCVDGRGGEQRNPCHVTLRISSGITAASFIKLENCIVPSANIFFSSSC